MRFLSLLIAVCLLAIGAFVLPGAWGAGQYLLAKDDPAALTNLGLRAKLTPELLNAEMTAALDTRSQYLADSFIVLAEQERIAIPADLRKRHDDQSASYLLPVELFAQGILDGRCTSNAGFAGARISDMLIVGDLRDLYGQADNYRGGRPIDEMVVGLAAVGLVSTAAVPAHTAISAIKGAAKAGRLSQPLRGELTGILARAVDPKAVLAAVSEIGIWDWIPTLSWQETIPSLRVPLLTKLTAAVGALVHYDALTSFTDLTGDLVILASGDTGICGAQDALAVIHNGGELKRVLRLAEARKGATPAVLKLLGRDALVLPEQQRSAMLGWVGGGAGYVLFGIAALWRGARNARRGQAHDVSSGAA
ncbi:MULTISPECIES: hypothetical protein [Rhodomicrobium]|uniref:hypothetical protein n=1 Tax=Rhodomicrobium TaxID=1068 RepID=UPI000F745EB1|nr:MULTISPECIES: hypothetical protein [Rhodomicrobium]